MRLLIVTAMFPPIQTGTSFYSRNLAIALAKSGHSVTVVTAANRDARDHEEGVALDRLPALHVPLRNYFKHLRFTTLFPWNFVRIARTARRCRPDAIVLVNHYLDIALLAVVASRFARAPLLCSVGTQIQSLRPVRHWMLRVLDRAMCGRLVFPFCDRVIAWDSEIVRYLQVTHGSRVTDKTVIVPYGVNGDVADHLAHDHPYGVHRQVLGVGAVIEQRNFLSLIHAFALAAATDPEASLKIVGHVYYDAAVRLAHELGIQDRVTFMGEQPHAVVLREMKRSACLWALATGRYLGLGTAAIEAMCLGVPVVSNVPTSLLGADLLCDGHNYLSCPTDVPDAPGRILATILADRALQERIGRGGRTLVREHMQWDDIAAAVAHIVDEIRAVRNENANRAGLA